MNVNSAQRGATTLLLMSFVVAAMAVVRPIEVAAQNKAPKKSPKELDPTRRPPGSLAAKQGAKSARYYIWHDQQGWHLRTTANGTRRFHGTVRVKNGTIASCVPVGLKGDGKKAQDAWRVEPKRKELTFDFKTSTASDGLDIRIDGNDAELEFDLSIDDQKRPRAVFLGREQQHPSELPFRFKAIPQSPPEKKAK